MEYVKIDGSIGEGGGQIIRTAISLSCITKKPVHIENIRKNRKTPGLKAQHLTTVRILQKMCNAKTSGAEMHSTEMCFIPGEMKSCKIKESTGTAGSTCLILQSVIPAMAASGEYFEMELTGGTDVPWSPTFDYTYNVAGEAFNKMGMNFSLRLDRRGYYPKGAGRIMISVQPDKIIPAILTHRNVNSLIIKCSYSKIPKEIIEDKIGMISRNITKAGIDADVHIINEDALDPGATILVCANDAKSVMGADALFDIKSKTFDLKFDRITKNHLGVDENLADMLVLPASIACGMTILCVPKITKHLETNLHVASKISGCKYGIGRLKDGFEVRIQGESDSCIHQGGKK